MEFGAGICTPRTPHCDACPIAEGCTSRYLATIVPVPRQAAFAGSDRAHRGAVLRALSTTPGHAIATGAARRLIPQAVADRILGDLERDGHIHRSGGRLVLGGRPEPVATIGA
jgi:A/G-specific adenine glycosylase